MFNYVRHDEDEVEYCDTVMKEKSSDIFIY